ncbi:hypothetical protein [Magnetovibrio sp.]|uniref:hypothetical protein n=1 Tax=Magnetovibrio sp. TaxID=2024836 RepID=UPI002F95441D
MNADEIILLEHAFVEGYRSATDKLGFMRLAGLPMELNLDGQPPSKLVEVKVSDTFTVGTAAPGFGSTELVYHPLPSEMVTSALLLEFLYVHAHGRESYSLAQLLAVRDGRDPDEAAHDHAHAHGHHHHHPH